MTKKDLLSLEAFAELPDDAEIVFNTSKQPEIRVPLTTMRCWYERRCTNLEYINKAPESIRGKITPKYKSFFVINAFPDDYLKKELNITIDL